MPPDPILRPSAPGWLPLIGLILLPSLLRAEEGVIPLGGGCILAQATVDEGAGVLGAEDDFTRRMSPFDRQARLRSAEPVSDAGLRAVAARSVLPWTADEWRAIAAAAEGLDRRFEGVAARFPGRVLLIKTSGDEEGNAAYTRGTAVVLPQRALGGAPEGLRRLLCHELFHVLSRADPELRDALYADIGFSPCGDVRLPGDLEDRRITNPDAPAFAHAIRVGVGGERRLMVPVLYSREARYDGAAPLFASMEFRLLGIHLEGEPPRGIADVSPDGSPILVRPEETEGFFEQVGRNTGYLIHPEEILADNFVLLVLGGDPRNPEVVDRLRATLRGHATGAAAEPDGGRDLRR